MKRTGWRLLATGVVIAGLAAPALCADDSAAPVVATIILRESGKPDRTCIVEKSTPQADGTMMHDVRDSVTGEKMRVLDQRRTKSAAGLVTARVAAPKSTEAAAAIPAPISMTSAKKVPARVPTTAELAGSSTTPLSPYAMRKSSARVALQQRNQIHPALVPMPESPLHKQLTRLKEALGPSERELAAMHLAVGNDRTNPQVVAALTDSAKNDPAPTVRACCVRCLHRLSSEAPQVVPKIMEMQNDPHEDVKKAAEQAVQEISMASESTSKK